MKQEEKIHYIKIAIWFLITAVAIWFAIKIYKTIIIFGVALLLAYLLNPIVNLICQANYPFTRKKISRPVSIAVVYILLILIISLLCLVTFPLIVGQINNLINILPGQFSELQNKYYEGFKNKFDTLPGHIKGYLPQIISQFISKTGTILEGIFQALGKFFINLISGIFLVFMALIVAIFLLLNWESLKEKILGWFPRHYKDDVLGLDAEFHQIFGNFIKGTIILSVLTAIINIIMFLAMGLFWHHFQYGLTISLLNGLTYGIPYFGVMFVFVLGFILGYIQTSSFVYGFVVAIIVLIANKIVDNFFCPKIMGDSVGVSPLFIIFAAFAGGELFGIWGMVIGVPLAAIIKSISSYIYKKFLK